jgi:hypothetical protein
VGIALSGKAALPIAGLVPDDVDLAVKTIVWTLPFDGKIWKLKYKTTSTTQP